MNQNTHSPPAHTSPSNLPINLPQELAYELAGLGVLSDLDAEDMPLPYLIYNAKFKDPDGNWIPKDVFVNSINEETRPEINCVLIHIRKTRRYTKYEEGVGTLIRCRSDDRIEGISDVGEVRDCSTCKLKDWGAGHGRESAPRCGIIYNLLGVDTDNGQPFIVRAKSTSLRPVQKYIARHFTGKLHLPDGTYADLPLFTCRTRLSLDMPSGTYAVLKLTYDSSCTEEEIRRFKALYELFRGPQGYNAEDDIPENGADTEDKL